MSDRDWYRAVARRPVYTQAGEDQQHVGPRFPSRTQAYADGERMASKHDVDVTVAKEPLPEDPTEVFEE